MKFRHSVRVFGEVFAVFFCSNAYVGLGKRPFKTVLEFVNPREEQGLPVNQGKQLRNITVAPNLCAAIDWFFKDRAYSPHFNLLYQLHDT